MAEYTERDGYAGSEHAPEAGAQEAAEKGPEQEILPAVGQSAEIVAASYKKAREAHRADLKSLDNTITAGLKEKDTKYGDAWPNAAAWIRAGKTKLVALTSTHDAEARATALGKEGKRAMFGMNTSVPGDSDYDKDNVRASNNIYCANPSWGGFRMGGRTSLIAIVQPSKGSKDRLMGVIVHEVQHDADHHKAGNMGSFETEFRAYWIQEAFAGHSAKSGSADPGLKTADGTTLSGFDNRRAQAIYVHLWNSGSYDYVKTLWNNAGDRAKVLAMKAPKGTNLVNSPRLDDVYLALTKGKSVNAIIALTKALTVADLKALGASGMRGDWEALVKRKVRGASRMRVLSALGIAPGAAGVQWAVLDQIYEILQGAKTDSQKFSGLAGRLTQADRAMLQRPEMKGEWTALVNSRFDGADRAKALKALGFGA